MIHALELEAAIIGACLLEKQALPLVDRILTPEMFYDARFQLLFAALKEMYHSGQSIDILTVKEEMARRGQLAEVGGAYEITRLSSLVASSAHIEYHALIVHQKYLRRQMILGFNKLLAQSGDETFDIADTLVDAHNLLDQLEGQSSHVRRLRDMKQLMDDTVAEAKQRVAKGKDGITGIPTGLPDLDRLTAGWQNGDLIVGAARPGVGKTAFAMLLARTAAEAGYHTLVYSLEMQGERLGDRLLMSACRQVGATQWRNGKMNGEGWQKPAG